jgi:hypothetical protein
MLEHDFCLAVAFAGHSRDAACIPSQNNTVVMYEHATTPVKFGVPGKILARDRKLVGIEILSFHEVDIFLFQHKKSKIIQPVA